MDTLVAPTPAPTIARPEPAVLIQFDCEGETANRFGLPVAHRHRPA